MDLLKKLLKLIQYQYKYLVLSTVEGSCWCQTNGACPSRVWILGARWTTLTKSFFYLLGTPYAPVSKILSVKGVIRKKCVFNNIALITMIWISFWRSIHAFLQDFFKSFIILLIYLDRYSIHILGKYMRKILDCSWLKDSNPLSYFLLYSTSAHSKVFVHCTSFLQGL